MKKLVRTLLALVITLAILNAQAIEQYEPQLPGVTEGVPAGALPPPGMYGDVEVYTASFTLHDNAGKPTSVHSSSQVIAPMLLWNTGKKILGGEFAIQVIQAVNHTDVYGDAPTGTVPPNAHWGTFNTVLIPVMLGWHLPHDFHIKTALAINLNDASSSTAKPPPVDMSGTGNGYSSVIPNIGVSWLSDGWNLSANFFYAFNQPNTVTQYQSGQVFQADYTIAKSFEHWMVGLGAFEVNQITADSGNGTLSPQNNCAANNGCKERRLGLGPLIGYTFDGGIAVKLMANHDIVTVNNQGGNIVNLSLFLPLHF